MAFQEIGPNLTPQELQKINANFQQAQSTIDSISGEVLNEVITQAQLVWKEPVTNFAELTTSYPAAETGWTAMARDTGKVYRYNGTSWGEIQQIDAGPINELDSRLTGQMTEIEQTKADDDTVRKKTVKIMPDDLSPETLGLVTGTGSVNVLSEPQKESVTVEKFRGKTLVRGLNIYEKQKHFTLGWIDQNGTINSSTTFGHARVPVYPNETYSFWRETGTGYGETAGLILFFDEGFNVIGSVIGDNVKNGTYLGKPVITLQTPANCYYVGVNVKLNSYDDSTTFIFIFGDKINSDILNTKKVEKLLGAELVDATARQAIDNFNSGIKTTGNLYEYPTQYVPDFYISNLGAIGAAAGWGYAKVPVDGMSQISLLLPFNNYSGAIGSIGYYSAAMTMINYVVNPTVDGTYEGIGFVTLELPVNTAFLIVNVKRPSTPIYDNKETLIVVEGDSVDDYSISENVVEINNLPIQQKSTKEYEGLKWAVVGDSLTEKNTRATRNYHSYIAEETGITVVNMGVSGTGYKRQEETNNAFYQRISNIPTDVDVVTIFGSGNDLSLIANLGNATDTGTSTICGCINTTIDNLYAVLPTVPLGIIAPTPWQSTPPNVVGNNMALYVDKLEEICKLRGIPFLNLYRESGLRPWNAAYRTLMYSRDDGNGVHPDENGHKLFAPNVKEFLRKLISK